MNNNTSKILVVVLFIFSGLNIYFNFSINTKIDKLENKETTETKLEKPRLSIIPTDNNPKIGVDKAPVKVIVFLDYECPYCKLFIKDQLPIIQKKYISNNLVQVVFRDYPLPIHQKALELAQLAHITHQKNTFNEFLSLGHSLGFDAETWVEKQSEISALNDSSLKFIQNSIDKSQFLAGVAGITATPTFIINNRVLIGLRKMEELISLIDYSLSNPSGQRNASVSGSCN